MVWVYNIYIEILDQSHEIQPFSRLEQNLRSKFLPELFVSLLPAQSTGYKLT
jgi:hypothetical protein